MIVRAIIGLGEDLGISTTAEGVETVEQLAYDPRRWLHRGAGVISHQSAAAGRRDTGAALAAGFQNAGRGCQAGVAGGATPVVLQPF